MRIVSTTALLPARLLALPARITLSGTLHAGSGSWAAAVLSAERHVGKVAAVALEAALHRMKGQSIKHVLEETGRPDHQAQPCLPGGDLSAVHWVLIAAVQQQCCTSS